MPRLAALVTLAASLLALPAPASAGGAVCLWDASNEFLYRFTKLKVPKQDYDVVPVVGLAFSAVSANAVAVSGGLHRDGNTGKLLMGLTRYGDRCLLFAVLEENLSGTLSSDCNLDDANDSTVALARVDCADYGF
jgi:hypothetical protein